jgi:hypothetical protein
VADGGELNGLPNLGAELHGERIHGMDGRESARRHQDLGCREANCLVENWMNRPVSMMTANASADGGQIRGAVDDLLAPGCQPVAAKTLEIRDPAPERRRAMLVLASALAQWTVAYLHLYRALAIIVGIWI